MRRAGTWSSSSASMCVIAPASAMPGMASIVCAGPGIDDHVLAAKRACAAIAQCDLDRLGRDEIARAQDQLRAGFLVDIEMHVDQPLDHLALAVAHSSHVDVCVVLADAEFLTAKEKGRNLRAVDDVLARQARDVGA